MAFTQNDEQFTYDYIKMLFSNRMKSYRKGCLCTDANEIINLSYYLKNPTIFDLHEAIKITNDSTQRVNIFKQFTKYEQYTYLMLTSPAEKKWFDDNIANDNLMRGIIDSQVNETKKVESIMRNFSKSDCAKTFNSILSRRSDVVMNAYIYANTFDDYKRQLNHITNKIMDDTLYCPDVTQVGYPYKTSSRSRDVVINTEDNRKNIDKITDSLDDLMRTNNNTRSGKRGAGKRRGKTTRKTIKHY